jgi:hypothetical protein
LAQGQVLQSDLLMAAKEQADQTKSGNERSEHTSVLSRDHLAKSISWSTGGLSGLAVSEGCARRNPAELLFTPREAKKPERRALNMKEVNRLFETLERTHSSRMRGLNVDPKIVADQQGHTLDVNMNVYTQTSLASRIGAVNALESALVN